MPSQKIFNWNPDKNQLLIFDRGISFERIVFEISCGNELVVLEHPNQDKYPGQRISMVQVDDYVYAVPFTRPVTKAYMFPVVTVYPPGLDVTVYDTIVKPLFIAGAVH